MKSTLQYLISALIVLLTATILTLTSAREDFLLYLTSHRHPVADYFFYYITKLGEAAGYVIVGVILIITKWRKAITIPIAGLLVTIVTYFLKRYFRHERPSIYLDRIQWEGPLEVLDYQLLQGHTSFPSGHSMAAWALFSLTAFLIPQRWVGVLCLIFATAVSISRVYLVAHFLQDVVAGAWIGLGIGFVIYAGYRFFMKKGEKPLQSSI